MCCTQAAEVGVFCGMAVEFSEMSPVPDLHWSGVENKLCLGRLEIRTCMKQNTKIVTSIMHTSTTHMEAIT